MPIRVAVAEDHALVRAGLRGILESDPELLVVADVATGRAAVDVAHTAHPDVVLMDIRMPGMDGLHATRLITGSLPARVLVLTTFDLDEYVYEALRNGASGFLLKDTPPADLIAAVRIVAAGDALLSPGVTRRLIADFVARPAPPPPVTIDGLDKITSREHDVLLLVAEGLSNSEIARRLYIEPGTVKTHVAHLLSKLGARDRVQLVIAAYRAGVCGSSAGY